MQTLIEYCTCMNLLNFTNIQNSKFTFSRICFMLLASNSRDNLTLRKHKGKNIIYNFSWNFISIIILKQVPMCIFLFYNYNNRYLTQQITLKLK